MSGTEVLISVIVPVCNGEAHLQATLDSVLAQRHRALELIVVDDGSTDATPALLADLAAADPRVRALRQPNRGVSAARNRGLDAAHGEWILFLDADDLLIDPLLLTALVRAGGDDADIVGFASTDDPDAFGSVGGDGDQRLQAALAEAVDVVLDHREIATMIAAETANAVWDKAYRRTLIDAGGTRFLEGIRMGEDLLFNLDCISRAEVVRTVPIRGHFYRRGGAASATGRYLPDKFTDLTIVGTRLADWAQGTGSPELVAAVDFIRAKNVFSCVRDLHRPDCDVPREQRLARAREYRIEVPSVRMDGLGPGRRVLGSAYNLLGYRSLFRLTGLVGGRR